ncbi:protein ADP-ribosylarginine hydrolase [Pelomyxa schiedti]|nr:protein ADP-ribosylarginine hydrolase [Pelomyxa schiedti]
MDRYIASMVLSGVGDGMGYRWEFNFSGKRIHKEVLKWTGGKGPCSFALDVTTFPVSDDTVMALATAEGLVEGTDGDSVPAPHTLQRIAKAYKRCWSDMGGRAPGGTCSHGVSRIRHDGTEWDRIPFSTGSGGCGAAMRAAPIGLRYPRPEQLPNLIAVAIESGRMTHHNGTGYLGSVAAALFTSYAIQNVPVRNWGWMLIDQVLPLCRDYIKSADREVEENLESFGYFETKWREYLELRHLRQSDTDGPVFPEAWGVEERDDFYKSVSYSGWGGSSGHDAPMIAYDSLLWSGNSWEKLCWSGILHGGDNDSTGCIAGAMFGALYGIEGVPLCNYEALEYRGRLETLGRQLYTMNHTTPVNCTTATTSSATATTTTTETTTAASTEHS